MKRTAIMIAGLVLSGLATVGHAAEPMPWNQKGIDITIPGEHSLRIDGYLLHFLVPEDFPNSARVAKEVETRSREILEHWYRTGQPRTVGCFGLDWDFYFLGVPLLGRSGTSFIAGTVYLTTPPTPENTRPIVRQHRGFTIRRVFDYSWPSDLKESRSDFAHAGAKHYTPIEEVVINGRRWYHYLRNSDLYPNYLNEYYLTGLAPDRYLEVEIRMGSLPFYEDLYPRYPAEEHQPAWLKRAIKNKEQVISSLRLTRVVPATEPDLYEVQGEASATVDKDTSPPANIPDRDTP